MSLAHILDYQKFWSDEQLAEKIMRWLCKTDGYYTYYRVLRLAEDEFGNHMSDRRIRAVQRRCGYAEAGREFYDNGKLRCVRYKLTDAPAEYQVEPRAPQPGPALVPPVPMPRW